MTRGQALQWFLIGVVSPDSGILRLLGIVVSCLSIADASKSDVTRIKFVPTFFGRSDMLPMGERKTGSFRSRRTMLAQSANPAWTQIKRPT